jgi:dihydrofolate reductase
MISIIAAAALNGVIGAGGRIPWNIPEDTAYFRNITYGGAVIMGRRTYDEIGRPLKGRLNIVVTSDKNYKKDGISVADSLEKAIGIAKSSGKENIFLCGGAGIYREGIDIADRIYLTVINKEYDGDVFFPDIIDTDFELVSSEKCPTADIVFNVYDRKITKSEASDIVL